MLNKTKTNTELPQTMGSTLNNKSTTTEPLPLNGQQPKTGLTVTYSILRHHSIMFTSTPFRPKQNIYGSYYMPLNIRLIKVGRENILFFGNILQRKCTNFFEKGLFLTFFTDNAKKC